MIERSEASGGGKLHRRLLHALALLRRIQPERSDGDILWRGPYFMPRSAEWWPTQFLLCRDELYCTVNAGWSAATLVWEMGRNRIRFELQPSWSGLHSSDTQLWERILAQVERRLAAALRSPAAYNRRVARLLPLRCRTGRIKRKFTWPRRSRPPLTTTELRALETALEQGKRAESWSRLSLRRYLETAATAYDAAFPELRPLTPRKKYQRRADQRHGGLLELRPTDTRGFERWYYGRTWLGTHPWEIVFGHPHGILLSPDHDAGAWRFFLGVDALGFYREAARMAIALGEAGVPFELTRSEEVIAALRGEDWVEVGPFPEQMALDVLEERRRGATSRVSWDDPPRLVPVSARKAEGPKGDVLRPNRTAHTSFS